jgi:hypothetical protein
VKCKPLHQASPLLATLTKSVDNSTEPFIDKSTSEVAVEEAAVEEEEVQALLEHLNQLVNNKH